MQIQVLRTKIHRAQVTQSRLDYEGSLTIDEALMEKVGMVPYERILCGNLANGNRFETYAIKGRRGSGDVILNGAVAHLGKAGDRLTIMSYTWAEPVAAATWNPSVIVLDEKNRIVSECKGQ